MQYDLDLNATYTRNGVTDTLRNHLLSVALAMDIPTGTVRFAWFKLMNFLTQVDTPDQLTLAAAEHALMVQFLDGITPAI